MKKKILAALLTVCCFVGNVAAFAAPSQYSNGADMSIQSNNNEIMPMTMYYVGNSIYVSRATNYAYISVATMAVDIINHIYHDVTIYKNGALYMSSKRYNGWNCFRLDTTINVPAKPGDYIEVYLDSYTEHNGCLESGHASESFVY